MLFLDVLEGFLLRCFSLRPAALHFVQIAAVGVACSRSSPFSLSSVRTLCSASLDGLQYFAATGFSIEIHFSAFAGEVWSPAIAGVTGVVYTQ
jgi:hypothetical protein